MKQTYRKPLAGLLYISLLVLGNGCKKYLDLENPSTISQDATFNSVSYTNSAIIGVYNQLCGDNGATKEGTIWGLMADDFKTSGSYSSQDRRGISMWGATDDNGELQNGFNQLYTGIERANICIRGIKASPLFAEGNASKSEMAKLLGEALTLRAHFYFSLVRNWGSVVAQWEPSAHTPMLDVPVTNGTEILEHLLDDLKEAQELVPWRTESGYGSTRWTKGAIKALRAKIAMFRGGYMMDKESHTMLRSANYKDFYQIALDECKDIIAHREQHDLNPSYENVFKTLHSSTRLDPTFELMFEVGAYGAGARTDTKLGYYNGIRINASSRFGQGGGGEMCIATYFYEFDQLGDCRRDVTIGSYEINDKSEKLINTLNNMTDAKFRRSWTTMTGTTQTLAVNWPVIRFADVLLFFAEADNELNGAPSAEAKAALLEVRKRAFVNHEDRLPPMPDDHQGFFDAIVKERLLEFGGEAIRKYDLIRWNIIEAKFIETRNKLRQLMNGEGVYANIPKYVYVKPAEYKVINSVDEVELLDLYGGHASAVLFQPGMGTSTPPAGGWVTKNWRASLNEEYITGNSSGFATYFEANKKEVFPFHQTILQQNTNIVQNYGY
ncbi:RagB/SusD family nutrient uptake outer membrane protein [Pseudobacter ginsenosidimutans]|uniref:Putative outer membrane starch-binding protein n=1 Tax=Pseudobacter ginsenosidimutans TaxID=661488 RepID=A0A4Q7N6A7_9BACT|nr:RagB/SusD family nutrient uptake outer membrane protein [Pseudobacter ginsenosidimutans]QEC45055.1 RagB/SusD family nutrient uptake outer membrane protein [Pseudobacter ginsenosidimutans]RZS76550.1 putative outer membrane starch-binding protein [Pseudobacter ginsenosidimutans]